MNGIAKSDIGRWKWNGGTALALLACGLIAGGIAIAANPRPPSAGGDGAPPLQLKTSDRPPKRDAALTAGFADLVKRVSPSVVSVSTVTRAKLAARGGEGPGAMLPDHPFFRQFFGDGFGGDPGRSPWRMPPTRGEGSGVIVSPDGYILTNDHVIDGADSMKVALADGREFTARVVGKDPKTDIALLKVDASDLPAIEIADSANVQVGDLVLALGNPFGVGQSVTLGMVSAKGRAPLGLDYQDFLQTDAAVNPGNSGGALVDVEGRLVGINTAILSRSGGNQGVAFAIPSNLAREVMDGLVKYGRVIRGHLGVMIQDLTPALAKEFKLDVPGGALVAEVMPGGPAARAGFKTGDVIVAFGGVKVGDSRQLKLEVAKVAPGESVTVEILRDGARRELRVKAGELPGEPVVTRAGEKPARGREALAGVGVGDLSAETRRELRIPEEIRGALVTHVEEGSAAAEAGLKPGAVITEINRQPVKGPEDAVRLTGSPDDPVTLVRIWERGGSRFVVVDESGDKNA